MNNPETQENDFLRRPIPQRSHEWAQKIAAGLIARKISPNRISFAGVIFAAIGALALILAGVSFGYSRSFWFIIAAACVALRLLCNMFDGMVAVEGKMGAKDGALWNELPDRIADSLILIGAGFGVGIANQGGEWLGYFCAILAILTAYIREIGTRLGMPADFSGPFAKPQRMWAILAACFLGVFEWAFGANLFGLKLALWVIFIGTFYTCYRRTINLRNFLLQQ